MTAKTRSQSFGTVSTESIRCHMPFAYLLVISVTAEWLADTILDHVARRTSVVGIPVGRIVEISPGSVPIMPILVPTDLDVDVRSVEMSLLRLDRSSTSNCQRANQAKRESSVDYSPRSRSISRMTICDGPIIDVDQPEAGIREAKVYVGSGSRHATDAANVRPVASD